jgi:tetratricopeptide (TPR) repeat protein
MMNSIKANPEYATPYNNRGAVYENRADYHRAIEDFNTALKLDPSYANAIANRAEAYLKKRDYVSASKDFDEAIRLQPKLDILWNERCWTSSVTGDLTSALADCNAAIQLTPQDASLAARSQRADLSENRTVGCGDRRSALKIDPKIASSLYGADSRNSKKPSAAAGNADIAVARAVNPKVADEFSRYGVKQLPGVAIRA